MHAHLDLFCGASGDMLLGALVDAGVSIENLQQSIDALQLDGLRLRAEPVTKRGIAATKVDVEAPEQHVHRHLRDIEGILAASALTEIVRAKASDVFRTLAEAEARVHGIAVNEVHFHEVGALDAIADVVGVVAGLQVLGVSTLSCRALPVSYGTVWCEHGILPVPAPAVMRLMEGLPTEPLDVEGETLTPTAAALLRTLVTEWGDAPAMRIQRQGYGAGSKEFPRANVLRLVLGARASETAVDSLLLLSTNIDDMNPEWLPTVMDRLLAAGALDVWLTPILMKKGRPAHTLSVLADSHLSEALRGILFTHTTSLGVRTTLVDRHHLERRVEQVDTVWGPVRVKVATLLDGSRRAAPEFEDCRRLSEVSGVPLQTLYDASLAAWRDRLER